MSDEHDGPQYEPRYEPEPGGYPPPQPGPGGYVPPPEQWAPPAQYGPPSQYGPPAPVQPFGAYPPPQYAPPGSGLYGAEPPPRKRRRGLLIAIAAVAVLAIVGVVLGFVLDGSDDAGPVDHTVALPARVDGYQRIQTIPPQQLTSLAGGSVKGLSGAELSHAKVATFGQGGQPDVVFVGITLDHKTKDSSGDLSQELLKGVTGSLGATAAPSTYAPGPLGGALAGGVANAAGRQVAYGAWSDDSTVGLILMIDTGASADQAAALTKDFRAAAEK